MNEAARFGRLLKIASTLMVAPGATPAELAQICGVSARTAFRDLAQLERLGMSLRGQGGLSLQQGLFGQPNTSDHVHFATIYDELMSILRARYGSLADQVAQHVREQLPTYLCLWIEQSLNTLLVPSKKASGPHAE